MIELTIKLVDALTQLLQRAPHPLNARPRLTQRLRDRLRPASWTSPRPLAVHERNIPCPMLNIATAYGRQRPQDPG
jgi:hypothetical protein